MWVATSGVRTWWWAALAAASTLLLIALWRRHWFAAGVGVFVALCLLAGGWRTSALAGGGVAHLAADGAVVRAEVVVTGAARWWPAAGARPALWRGQGQLRALEGRGTAWTSGAPVALIATGEAADAWAGVAPGTRVEVFGVLSPADPGEPAAAVLRAREPPRTLAPPGPVDAAVAGVRSGLRAACSPLPPDARALLPALVVGDTAGMPDDLVEQFRVTGLTHLTAVSGANLTLLLVFLRAVAVAAGARGRSLKVVLAGGVAAFVAVCLAEPSVVRAAAMGLVGLAALGRSGRGDQGLRYLATAVLLVVLVDPWLSRSVGFWLSVLASFGLLWWGRSWTDLLARWSPRWIAEAIAVALAAQVATEPVVVWLSGRVSVVGVIANVVVAPLVGPATVLGVLAALASVFVPGVAVLLAWLGGVCAQSIAWVARLGAALPGAALDWPQSPAGVALAATCCLAAVLMAPLILPRPAACLLLGGVVIGSLAVVPRSPGWPPPGWAVVACDVGQGDALVLNAGAGAAVVVDTGPEPRLLASCLGGLGVRVAPLVVLTHLHADHAAGVEAVRPLGVRSLVTSGVRTPESSDRRVEALGVSRHLARAGDSWTVGAVVLRVLAAPERAGLERDGEGESSAENDASLLLRADVGGVSVLLAGDAEVAGQEERVGLGEQLDVDVLVVPHHGSARQSADFLMASRPQVALISVGAGNPHGHPAPSTLRAVARTGATVLRTDERGSLAVARVNGRLLATTSRRRRPLGHRSIRSPQSAPRGPVTGRSQQRI